MPAEPQPTSHAIDLDPTIVRGYDVRGYVRDVQKGGKTLKQNLTPKVAEAFGRALGSMMEAGRTVAVTSDHRHLSFELVAGLTRGFCAVGINVLHNAPQALYGGKPYLPTGALTWFLIKSNLAGSVQVTGSHNPPEFNGFKIAVGLEALYGPELQKLVPIIREGRFRPDVKESERGQVRVVDMLGQYLAMLGHAFPHFTHQRRVVVDAGNGIGRVIAPFLATKGYQVEELYPEPDARFPNHLADPSSDEGTRALKARVRELNANLSAGELPWIGIALDGDSDRSGLVDEAGEVVWPERMAAVFYADYLKKPEHAGHMLALDVRASHVVRDAVEKNGGRGVFIPAGYPSHRKFARLEVAELNKVSVGVSAEASGHFFFPSAAIDENGSLVEHAQRSLIDDGIYSALVFLQIVDRADAHAPMRVVDFMRSLPTYHTSAELRLFAPDEVKASIVEHVKDELLQRYGAALGNRAPMQVYGGVAIQDGRASVVEVDGVRLQFDDGAWFVVRVSNTSPCLVVKFEAADNKRLVSLMRSVREVLAGAREVELTDLDHELSRLQAD